MNSAITTATKNHSDVCDRTKAIAPRLRKGASTNAIANPVMSANVSDNVIARGSTNCGSRSLACDVDSESIPFVSLACLTE